MSVKAFPNAVGAIRLSKTDRDEFPRWIERYAKFLGLGQDESLPVDATHLVAFLSDLRERRVRAGLRLQATKALECYRNVMLLASEPSFLEIESTLQRCAVQQDDDHPDEMVADEMVPELWRDSPSSVNKLFGDLDPIQSKLLRD